MGVEGRRATAGLRRLQQNAARHRGSNPRRVAEDERTGVTCPLVFVF